MGSSLVALYTSQVKSDLSTVCLAGSFLLNSATWFFFGYCARLMYSTELMDIKDSPAWQAGNPEETKAVNKLWLSTIASGGAFFLSHGLTLIHVGILGSQLAGVW